MKVGNATTEGVAVHVCETVLPFLEELQDLCDAMEVRDQWIASYLSAKLPLTLLPRFPRYRQPPLSRW